MKPSALFVVLFLICCGFRPSVCVKIGVVYTSLGPFAVRDLLILDGVLAWQNWTNARGGILLGEPPSLELIEVVSRDGYSATNLELGKLFDVTLALLLIDEVDIVVGPFGYARTQAVAEAILNYPVRVPLLTNSFASGYLGAKYDFILGATAPPLQSYVEGTFRNYLEREIKKFVAVFRSSSAVSFIAQEANTSFANVYSKQYPGATLELHPYDATLIENVFDAALRVAQEVPRDTECFVSLGLSKDLLQFAAIFQLLSFSPPAAFSFYDLTEDQLLDVGEGWIVGAFYIPYSLNFGKSGIYMGSTREYENFFSDFTNHEPTGMSTGSSASCVVWQKAAERAGANWRNISTLIEVILDFDIENDTIFIGRLNFSNTMDNYAQALNQFAIQNNSFVYIQNASEIQIPAIYKWEATSSLASYSSSKSHETDDKEKTSLIVGLTLGLSFLCCLIILVAVTIIVFSILKFKYHFYFLSKS